MTDKAALVTGGCNCGAVRFEGALSDRGVGICHCKMCRRFASGPFVGCRFAGGIRLIEDRGLKWWVSSDWGRRGFCAECGATLFWTDAARAPLRDDGRADWSVSAGALDGDPDQIVFHHIFEDHRPGYLTFADDAPRCSEAEIRERHGHLMQGALKGVAAGETS